MSDTPITRADYKAQLIASYPPVIGNAEAAEILRCHSRTIQEQSRKGRLPFKNVSLNPRYANRFLTVDVIEWLFSRSEKESSKRKGRHLGSKNRAKAQAEV
jgi:hypothetical protein